MARPKAKRLSFPVEFLQQEANRLPLGDRSVDTAVMTWSLCSIDDPAAALREVRRVLKPGGALIFVEHGLSPDAGVRRWQNRLTPIWRHVAGGCHLNRKVDDLIREAGFEMMEISAGYMPGPRVGTYMYQGGRRTESQSRVESEVKSRRFDLATAEDAAAIAGDLRAVLRERVRSRSKWSRLHLMKWRNGSARSARIRPWLVLEDAKARLLGTRMHRRIMSARRINGRSAPRST